MRQRVPAAGSVAALAAIVLVLAGDPRSGSGNSDGQVVTVAALLAWSLVGWLGLGIALVAAERVPGLAGRTARRAGRVLIPGTLRAVAEAVVGVAVLAAPLAAPAAAAHRPWPDLDRATAPAHQHHVSSAVVVVAKDDCLWRIAADDLARHGHDTDDASVADEWPRWYAANRAVIGPDPDLVLPGQRLHRPTGATR